MKARRATPFGRDAGLEVRIAGTLLLLGAIYAALVAALLAAGAGALAVAAITGSLLLLQLFASDRLALRAMGARELSPREAPALHAAVERLCVQADLPKPRVALADSAMPNAFAIGRSRKSATVCVTRGLLAALAPSELEGVLAHELAHIKHRDVMVMTIASFFATLAAYILHFGLFFGGNDRNPAIAALVATSVAVYAISFLLMLALSRYRELAADRAAAIFTGRPSALASALMRISDTMSRVPQRDLRAAGELNAFFILPARSKAALSSLLSTHPPLERRLEALDRLEAQLQHRPMTRVVAPA